MALKIKYSENAIVEIKFSENTMWKYNFKYFYILKAIYYLIFPKKLV